MPIGVSHFHCSGIIAQGVRLNSKQKSVGKYYYAPVLRFWKQHIRSMGYVAAEENYARD
jgi:hypothetical protein